MSRVLRAIYYSLLILICAPASSHAAQDSTNLSDKLLNSERIAERFGNYAIEVISQDEDYRISNLYSQSNDVKTTRTLAVVDFLSPVDSSILELHQRVLQGESLGATFKGNGWQVRKISVAVEPVPVGPEAKLLKDWMHLSADMDLAMHVYLLKLAKDNEKVIDYAVIAELHHPDYLDIAAIKQIHGEPVGFSNITEILTNSIRSTLIEFINGQE